MRETFPRTLNTLDALRRSADKTPAVGAIENKDLKAAWHILKEFQGMGPRELNGNKTPAVGPIENRRLQGCMAYCL